MKIALLHKHFDAGHLKEVKSKMENLGAPVIRAVWMECFDCWAALEGCHRIRAAAELGLEPIIEEIEYSDDVFIDESGNEFVVSEAADDAWRAEIVEF